MVRIFQLPVGVMARIRSSVVLVRRRAIVAAACPAASLPSGTGPLIRYPRWQSDQKRSHLASRVHSFHLRDGITLEDKVEMIKEQRRSASPGPFPAKKKNHYAERGANGDMIDHFLAGNRSVS